MDNLIKELVEDFKKEKKKVEKEEEKTNNANKIVAKVNENGDVETLIVSGSKSALLSTICVILKEMAKNDNNDSAERMAKVILIALEMERELND